MHVRCVAANQSQQQQQCGCAAHVLLAFTGGIGENSSLIRAKTIGYLAILGLELDEETNEATRFGKAGIITRAEIPLAAGLRATYKVATSTDVASAAASS